MNDAHQVVGRAMGEVDTAFVFTPGVGSLDLQNAIPPASGWKLHVANDVNNAGQIVGYGARNGELRAFRLDPVTPPTATPNDTTAPTVAVTTPADGASYTAGQLVAADYRCADETGGSGLATCAGTVGVGEAVQTASAGSHTFTVRATDAKGNATTRSVTYTVLAGNATATVTDGGTLSTDPGGLGATAEIPVQTRILAPAGVTGTLSVTPSTTLSNAPSGYSFFGSQLQITGPGATAAEPYVATFTVDSSALGSVAPADLQVFRNGGWCRTAPARALSRTPASRPASLPQAGMPRSPSGRRGSAPGTSAACGTRSAASCSRSTVRPPSTR
jgi:hypothetical protein